jgi:hypothetical protein
MFWHGPNSFQDKPQELSHPRFFYGHPHWFQESPIADNSSTDKQTDPQNNDTPQSKKLQETKPHQEKGTVRIQDLPVQDPATTITSSRQTCSIIRWMDSPAMDPNDSTSNEDLPDTDDNNRDKVIHDKANKVLKEKSGDYTITYLVEGFAGLLPVWPFNEFPISLPGIIIDDRMTQYFCCVSALLERF